jgi:cytochrome bd-type quinol oxidase subunit 2
MRGTISLLDTGSRALSYFLGIVVLALAGAVYATSLDAGDIAEWTRRMFGTTFLVLLSSLILVALFSWARMGRAAAAADRRVWFEAGMHAASGIATLALTYTLLGISLGIGELAERELTPQTVNLVIGEITEHFSLAFMTTVVGLPVSAALRALLSLSRSRAEARAIPTATLIEGVRS